MLRKQYFLLLLCVSVGVTGCMSDHQYSIPELTDYVNDESHGLKKSVLRNGINLTVSLKPSDILTAQEIKTSSMPIDSLKPKYDHHLYFVLSLSSDNHESLSPASLSNYNEVLNTLSFRMADYVSLSISEKKFAPLDFMMDRTYGRANATEILFVFEKPDQVDKEKCTITIKEFGLNVGRQSFEFSGADIENLPRIRF